MSEDVKRAGDEARLNALRAVLAKETSPKFRDFDALIDASAENWVERTPVSLNASRHLADEKIRTSARYQDLLSLFAQSHDELSWEQSYSKNNTAISEAMLDDYAFTEVVGKKGPFISAEMRLGIGIWGPHLDYPMHRHTPEEIYLIIAGSADFTVGEVNRQRQFKTTPGQSIIVSSNTPHGFATTDEPVILVYLWRAGDMREISTFV